MFSLFSLRSMRAFCLLTGLLLTAPAYSQKSVPARDLYERVVAIVPMVGAGTYSDPRRPLWTPAKLNAADGRGIVSFSYQVSDDGNFAVLEVASRDREGLRDLLSERRAGVQVFERGKADGVAAEREIRKLIRDFDLAKFGARAR